MEMELRSQHIRSRQQARGRLQGIPERIEVFFINRNACRHFVTAKLRQMRGAIPQEPNERKSFNTPSAPLPCPIFIKTNNEGGTVKLTHDFSCNDTDHADMPIPTPGHDGDIGFRVESRGDRSHSFRGNMALDGLPLAIVLIERERKAVRLGVIIGKEKLKRLVCGPEATGGIDARSKTESDISPTNRRRNSRNRLQRNNPRPAGVFHPIQSMTDKNAILAD